MVLKTCVKSITYLKSKTADLVREVVESGVTVFITQNGEPKVAMMGIERYERLRNAMALLKLAVHAEGDVAHGCVVSQEEAFAAAEAVVRQGETRA